MSEHSRIGARWCATLAACLLLCAACRATAAEPVVQAEIRAAAERGLAALDGAAAKYSVRRHCFSCHHQTLPMLAQVAARSRGLKIDEALFRAQFDVVTATFDDELDRLRRGEQVGGKAMTVGYALWASRLADAPANAITESMVEYLLETQRSEGHWTGQMCRPPLEESYLSCTVLAIEGIRRYASQSQQARAAQAIEKASAYLLAAPAKGQEDKVARLYACALLHRPAEELAAARDAVLKPQQPDGGWAQLDEMRSDAYATGQTLYILQATGYDPKEAPYQHGLQFLVKRQRPDGYWLVISRSKPVQPLFDFDDEDPLGKDQFISVAGTAWSVVALLAALDQPE